MEKSKIDSNTCWNIVRPVSMKIPPHTTSALAEQLGVSRWTVSRALNGHAGINQKTAERIRAAAEEMGFSPSILGRGLRAGRTDLVGVCAPDLDDYVLTGKVSRLQELVSERGLHAMFHIADGSHRDERWALERFIAMRCTGVVLIASRLMPSEPIFESLQNAGVSVVSIDPMHPGRHRVVATDRANAMRSVVQLYADTGAHGVVTAGITTLSSYGRQRLRGIRSGCLRVGWDFARDVFHLTAGDAPSEFACGEEMGREYVARFGKTCPPVIALNDRIAVGLIRHLDSAGLRVPTDVRIIGYDNTDFSAYANPALSTIDPQVGNLIQKAVDLLTDPGSSAADRRILVKPELILRSTT